MTVVQINTTCTLGSTGKICMQISKLLTEKGIENSILHAQGECNFPNSQSYCTPQSIKIQAAKAHIIGNYGFNSQQATKRLIQKLEKLKPQIVHLHNIHSHECHLGMLLEYLKKSKIKIVWTFHDCWAFTAYCCHFDNIKCEKWKTGCYACPQYKDKSIFFDKSKALFEKKKQLLSGVDLTLITPSIWLANLVAESFLKKYPCYVIPNGIDTDTFFARPAEKVRAKYHIFGKMILGVAYHWDEKKGLDVFLALRKRLGKAYSIVLVGTDETVEKSLPKEIITIRRTQNIDEMAEIYSAADVFLNPTREENYPTVNMEAIACGTPVVTFRTGGSPEMLDATCGIVVEKNDIDACEAAIRKICETEFSNSLSYQKKAEEFEAKKCFSEYLKLYQRLLSD